MISQDYCFCELAPLYALDVLNQQERLWIEQQLTECPELEEELAEYQTAIAAVPYTVPSVPIADDLKARLFDSLNLNLPEPAPSEEPTPKAQELPFFSVRASEANWQPHPTPGVEVAILHANSIKREIVGLLRAQAGVCYPFHYHAATEELYMLAGDLIIGDQVYGAGDYIYSQPGSSHAPHTNGGCMFFFRTSMDDEYPDLVSAST